MGFTKSILKNEGRDFFTCSCKKNCFVPRTKAGGIAHNDRALCRCSIRKTFNPELKPIKDTKVENKFYSSSVFRQLDMQPIVPLR